MFKGTTSRGPGEFSRIVNRVGGSENAFTSHDYTGYYQNVARDQLGTMMALGADGMATSRLKRNEVDRNRKVIRRGVVRGTNTNRERGQEGKEGVGSLSSRWLRSLTKKNQKRQ